MLQQGCAVCILRHYDARQASLGVVHSLFHVSSACCHHQNSPAHPMLSTPSPPPKQARSFVLEVSLEAGATQQCTLLPTRPCEHCGADIYESALSCLACGCVVGWWWLVGAFGGAAGMMERPVASCCPVGVASRHMPHAEAGCACITCVLIKCVLT